MAGAGYWVQSEKGIIGTAQSAFFSRWDRVTQPYHTFGMKSSGFNGCPPVGAQIVRPRVFAVFRGKIFGKTRHAGRCRCRSLQIFSLAAGNRPSGRFASSSPQRGATSDLKYEIGSPGGELRRKPVRGGSTPQTLKIPNYKQKQQNRRAASALLAARRLLV